MAIDLSRRRISKALAMSCFVPITGRSSTHVRLISAARLRSGNYASVGLSSDLNVLWTTVLPGRGHMAAWNETTNEIAAFARRPNQFLLILDKYDGHVNWQIKSPPDRHFYGHGSFTKDGRYLLTTENNLETLDGIIGVYAVNQGYRRVGEFPSGGIGPHDIRRIDGEDIFVVANGGMQTHPDSGRSVLNLDSMEPNLSYLNLNGSLVAQTKLGEAYRLASIRHLSVMKDGRVAFGMQWQGDRWSAPPLTGVDSFGAGVAVIGAEEQGRRLHGYVGSVASNPETSEMAFSSPRAGRVEVYSDTGILMQHFIKADVCGIATCNGEWIASTGGGEIFSFGRDISKQHNLQFDNHLLAT